MGSWQAAQNPPSDVPRQPGAGLVLVGRDTAAGRPLGLAGGGSPFPASRPDGPQPVHAKSLPNGGVELAFSQLGRGDADVAHMQRALEASSSLRYSAPMAAAAVASAAARLRAQSAGVYPIVHRADAVSQTSPSPNRFPITTLLILLAVLTLRSRADV